MSCKVYITTTIVVIVLCIFFLTLLEVFCMNLEDAAVHLNFSNKGYFLSILYL